MPLELERVAARFRAVLFDRHLTKTRVLVVFDELPRVIKGGIHTSWRANEEVGCFIAAEQGKRCRERHFAQRDLRTGLVVDRDNVRSVVPEPRGLAVAGCFRAAPVCVVLVAAIDAWSSHLGEST